MLQYAIRCVPGVMNPRRSLRMRESRTHHARMLQYFRAIRERNTAEADRKAAVDALFAEKFGAKVAEMQTERISHTGGFHPIYSMLRFVMPGCF